MDKFDEFLKKQAKEEDKEFKMPESFNKRVEDVLRDLDDVPNKKEQVKIKKKILLTAASLAFVIIAGKAAVDLTNKGFDGTKGFDIAKSINYSEDEDKLKLSSKMQSSNDGYVEEADMADTSIENSIQTVINGDIEYIVYNNEEIKDKDKVSEISSYINSMKLESLDKQESLNWTDSMELIGENNYTVSISKQYIRINNVFYKCNETEIKGLINIIKG